MIGELARPVLHSPVLTHTSANWGLGRHRLTDRLYHLRRQILESDLARHPGHDRAVKAQSVSVRLEQLQEFRIGPTPPGCQADQDRRGRLRECCRLLQKLAVHLNDIQGIKTHSRRILVTRGQPLVQDKTSPDRTPDI